MFLFEGPFGSVLHITDCLSALTPHLARRIDYLFLARCSLRFPATQDSIRQEDVLVGVSKAFGSKIYVDREKNSDCHQRLAHVTPEILAADDAAPSTRFHVLSFPRLSEQATEILAQARAARQLKPLIIRPSSQWYAYYDPPPPEEASTQQQQQKPVLTEAMCDELGVWHVCLSMHSSREELEQALGILKPKWVVYTISAQAVLLTVEAVEKLEEVFSACAPSNDISQALEEGAEATVVDFEVRVEPPVTLFRSTRHSKPIQVVGLTEAATREQNPVSDESELLNDIKSDGGVEVVDLTEGGKKEHNLGAETEHDRGNREAELGAQEQNLNARARLTVGVCRHKVIADEGTEATEGMVSAAHVPEDGTTVTLGTGRSTDHQYSERASDSSTAVGSSKGLNASLRRLYKSMNVLVSRPLPSLVQLMAASKRPRVSQTAQL
ncbi:hypothetical protein Zm00014a_007217 [Zea mays]|uniref:DNA repair metallo-beta-lactamase domain-containing protein n=1 Tax=Zea mays TaxID=4577 RepID=A0A3L6E8X4_MAIZE|nr:hypothetical protein Zm00014a_007217 [Zea mays]